MNKNKYLYTRRDMLALGAGLAASALPGVSLAQAAAKPLITRLIPKSGEALPVIGLGTAIIFDIHDDDLWWCTADIGWITEHSYVTYAPLLLGTTTLVYEGAPDYPDPGILWKIVEEYGVTKFYTAPTAIRHLMRYGNKYPNKYNLSSLKILGTVGEPINPEAWMWYYKHIGKDP